MPAKSQKDINLLPQDEFEATVFGRVLRWALSTFRIIVIATEMIVMLAFLSRFWLDARNSDLDDEIRVREAEIKAQSEFETEFKKTQSKLKIFDALAKEENPVSATLEKITSLIPSDVKLVSYSLSSNSILVKGISGSERSIAQFVANLDSDDTFSEVSLSSVETKLENESLLTFSIQLKTKGK